MRAKPTENTQGARRWRRRGRRLLKVGLVLAVAGLIGGGWVYRSADAQIDQSLTELGTQLMAYEHANHQDMPRQLLLNGQVLHMSSGTASRTVTEVLDYFEARCAEGDGGLALQMQQLVAEHPAMASPNDVPESPTIREDDGRSGYVGCLDMGDASISVAELAERLHRFGQTGDVSQIGDARYVFAQQAMVDGEVSTHFVALWSEGEFNVERMFPRGGDAPGTDLAGVSRPPRARRVMQGAEVGQPQSLTVYESRRSVSELRAFYERDLERNGWTLVPIDGAGRPAHVPETLIAERGQRMVTVMLLPSASGEGASAAIFDTP